MKTRLAVVAALCLVTRSLAAQQPPQSWISLGLGGGTELLGIRDNTTWTLGRTLHVSVQFAPSASGWGVRGSAWHFDRTTRFGRALAAGAGVELMHYFSSGRTRPYATVGFGAAWLYYSGSERSPDDWRRGSLSGYQAVGIGIERRVGRVWLFTETKFNHFSQGQRFAAHIMPLTVGVRF